MANSPHYEDGKSDKYEEGATDADHRKCPEVDLTIAFGIREKLMISKSIDWKCSSHTWEVVSTDLLRKKLVVLLHLLASKMAKSFVLTDVTIFCPSGCHNFLSSGCPQEGFGVRLSHSSFNQIVGLSRHSIFTVWHRSVPNQLGNWRKKTLWVVSNRSQRQTRAAGMITVNVKLLLSQRIFFTKLRGWDPDHPPGLEKFPLSVYLWLHYTKSHQKVGCTSKKLRG